MRRRIVYPGQIPLETDLLSTNKETMLALGYLARAVLGTSTWVDGLGCNPTSPGSLSVTVDPGSIYSLQTIDGTAYSSITSDTGTVVKQGLLYSTSTITLATPGTVGYSINYLIQAQFQETDDGSTVLPYYNASDPTVAWSGPNNSGTADYTERSGYVVLNVKAGTAAATGSQTTPSADAGYVPLWVVTVAYGQTAISSGNIAQHASAPFITPYLPQVPSKVQSNVYNSGTIGGTANALTMTLTPAPASWAALVNAPIRGIITTTNTGAATLNVNGLGAKSIVLDNGSAVLANDLKAGAEAVFTYDGTNVQVAFASSMLQSRLNNGSTIVNYATAGTYSWTVPAGVYSVFVRVWGGGGGGGGNQSVGAGGGGGGGGYAEGYVAVTPGASITVTVGAAGAQGLNTPTDGGTGGTSSFGSAISATGGTGGLGAVSGSQAASGTGGNGTGGSYNATGGQGSSGLYFGSGVQIGGTGGTGGGGGGPGGNISSGLPASGQSPGGGGGGGAGNYNGALGAAGRVSIEYYTV